MVAWTQIGARLEGMRRELRLSKAQFGKMIGVSGQYVGMMERGIHGFSVETVVRICLLTGASVDYILFGVSDAHEDASSIAAIAGLSREQIWIALDIIKKVAQFINTENGNEALIREVASQITTV